MTLPFAFIIIKTSHENALQTPTLNTRITQRLYSVYAARLKRARGAIEDPTALQQRPHNAPYNTLCKRQAAAFILSMQHMHTVPTQLCWQLHSAHLGDLQFFNAVGRL